MKRIAALLVSAMLMAAGGAVAQSTYTVKLAAGTEDSTSWSISPDTAVSPGVTEGTTVTLTYTGSRKVKSVKATVMTIDLSTLTGDTTATNGMRLTGTLAGNYKISIAAGATVMLDGVTINTNGYYAGITCEGDATINLQGTNTVQTSHKDYPGIYVPSDSTLTIGGSGSLTASGGEFGAGIGGGFHGPCGNITINGGSVTATGGKDGAGIGGGYHGSCGNITITGGTVTATGGAYTAGIGNGYLGSCGDITITGGTVTAMGGKYGAGIGSGYVASCGDITITGGSMTATGGEDAAGIGSGYHGSFSSIAISYGIASVTATRGIAYYVSTPAQPIGAGADYPNGSPVTFDGVNVTGETINNGAFYGVMSIAVTTTTWTLSGQMIDLSTLTGDTTAPNGMRLTGTLAGNYKISIAAGATVMLDGVTINTNGNYAGITCEGDATINLQGTNTVQTSRDDYPGIYVPSGSTLTIGGSGSLTATGGEYAAGIGSGYYGPCGNITITGGTVTVMGGMYAAGIGSGYYGFCGNITITGGTVTATGGEDAAGIGSGYVASCGDITITGGTVTSMGGRCGAGIGSGYVASCGDITITGGTVTATGGEDAAGIGSGYVASCGDITITGGTVTAMGGKDAAGIGSGYHGSFSSIAISYGIASVTATRGTAYNGSTPAQPIGAGADDPNGSPVTIDGVENATPESTFTHFTSSVSGNTWTLMRIE